MYRILLPLLAVVLCASPALAQEDELSAGFHLGKYYATASMMASDLLLLSELVDQLNVVDITQENYDVGVITDEDIDNASLALAYAIWRMEFLIMPACEAGLASDAFSHPAMDEFKEPTQALLVEIKRPSQEFLDNADYEYLVAFTAAISEGEYVEDLFELAALARITAGVEE